MAEVDKQDSLRIRCCNDTVRDYQGRRIFWIRQSDGCEIIGQSAEGAEIVALIASCDLMIERGLERVRMFSWKKAVEQHLEVYRRLVS
jgi:hypothetical protein